MGRRRCEHVSPNCCPVWDVDNRLGIEDTCMAPEFYILDGMVRDRDWADSYMYCIVLYLH